MNKFEFKNLTPFKWFVLENFPFIEADFDALTEWQLFCKIGKEINKIIDSQNNVGTEMETLSNQFITLQNYVNNYFDNLDVQEEINNKLNEMAEDGTLQEIISNYVNLSSVLAYDTVENMKKATNLINGSFVKTYGYYQKNDKGGNFYKIRNITNDDVIDNVTIVALDKNETLIAELIQNYEMCVNQFGAYGDGIHDDTQAIQNAIIKHKFGTINFANCTYLISSPIKTFITNDEQNNLILEKTTIIKSNKEIECLFELGGLGGVNTGIPHRLRFFKGGILESNNCLYGIKINENLMGQNIIETEIHSAKNSSIYIPAGLTEYSSDAVIKDCYLNGIGSENLNYGIYNERPDLKVENTRINAVQIGVYTGKGGVFLQNVHGLAIFNYGAQEVEQNIYEKSKFILIPENSSLNVFNNCYCDSFCTFIESSSASAFILTSSVFYSYITNVDYKLFVLNTSSCRYNISNCSFEFQKPKNKHKGIIYKNFNDQICMRRGFVNIFDNQISFVEYLEKGDLLTQITNSYTPLWLSSNNKITSQWLLLGYIVAGFEYHQINLNIDGFNYNAYFKIERNSNNGDTYVTQRPGVSSSNEASFANTKINLGFKYVTNSNGYNIYAVYVKYISGNELEANIVIEDKNLNTPFLPLSAVPTNPIYTDERMDGIYEFLK